MKKGILLLSLLAALSVTALCEEKVVKTVGADKITQEDVEREIQTIPEQYRQYYSNGEGRDKVIDKIVEQKILKNVAVKEKITDRDDFKKEMEFLKEKMMANYVVKVMIIDKIKASDEDIKKEYEARKEEFKSKEEVNASHILLRTESSMSEADKAKVKTKAEGILKDALAGKNFAELAKANSEDGSRDSGGNLGWFERGAMVPEFEEACFTGEKGKVYPKLVETQFGYHIIKIDDKKEASYKNFDEVKAQLADDASNKKRMEEYSKWMDSLKKEYVKQ